VIKAEFSAAITLVLTVTWSFKNHSNLIWCSKKHFLLSVMRMCCLISLWKWWYVF